MAQISIGAPLSHEVNGSSISTHHHGNLWDDDFIQSLNSPYEALEYHQRCEKLIEEVKHLLLSEMMKDGNADDLMKRLHMVDILECLGIDRHFHHEIQVALHYVYRFWNELEGISVGSTDSRTKDLNATALGFRALRLHRYNVSSDAVKRWDISLQDRLPDYIKITLEFFFNTSNELNAEVAKMQELDMSAYIRKTGWERYLEGYMQEAEWMAARHVPTFDDYIKNGKRSCGMCILNLYSLLLMGQLVPDDILEQTHLPSKIHDIVELTARLVDDSKDFQGKKDGGEFASGIDCYLKDKPECTEEDAVNHLIELLRLIAMELNREHQKQDGVALCLKKFVFEVARGLRFIYKYRDGLEYSKKEMKEQITKIMVDQVPI